MNNAITIMLKGRPQIALIFCGKPSPACAAQRSLRHKGSSLNLFQLFSNEHGINRINIDNQSQLFISS
jgi:hypothetical protein